MDDKEFYENSKCLGMPLAFFFPEGDGGGRRSRVDPAHSSEQAERENAKFCKGEVCKNLAIESQDLKPCSVLDECLERALSGKEQGVRGGTSQGQRIVIRRSRLAAAS